MSENAELIVRDHRAGSDQSPAPMIAIDPSQLTEETVLLQVISRAAADKSIDLDRMERLLLMHQRLNEKRAEQQFIEAMAKFKEHPPRLVKDKHVSFPHRDGEGSTDYWHATLGAVCQAAVAGLGAVGISHRWDLKQLDGGRTEVTCVLTHIGGHSTRTTLAAGLDASGKKNAIQQMASSVTYLQRYTLLAATGLATEDQDDDGAKSEEEKPKLSDEQLANLEALITEVGADRARFLRYLKAESLSDIWAVNYETCVKLLEAKRR